MSDHRFAPVNRPPDADGAGGLSTGPATIRSTIHGEHRHAADTRDDSAPADQTNVDVDDPLQRVRHKAVSYEVLAAAREDCSPITGLCGYVGNPCRPTPIEKCPMCLHVAAERAGAR